jgi:integrase
MKATIQKTTEANGHPVFHNVGENLYRLETSGGYYALIKKGGKQFRRSLKTKDRKLAERRLSELKEKVGVLRITEDAHVNFRTLADRWLDSRKHKLAESTAEWYGYLIKNLAEFFGDASIRNITVQDCERWAATRRKTAGTKAFVSELDTMNAVFQYAIRHGLILMSPAAHVERPTVRQPKIQVPSLTEFRQIVAAIRESDGRPGSQQRAKTGADLVELLAYSGARVAEITGGPKKRSPLRWSHVDFNNNTVFLPGTKTESAPRWIPMSPELRSTLERLKTENNPAPNDAVISISDARTCLETACRKLGFPTYTHHDFRHFFATTCIESGVDVPTVSRWLGHADGGALAMKRYGHLRQEHSLAMSQRVSFDKPANVIPMPSTANSTAEPPSSPTHDERRIIANAKATYRYPWWASENPLEVFWGQLHEEVVILPLDKLLENGKRAMGREVLKSELADRQSLIDELVARVAANVLDEIRAKFSRQKMELPNLAAQSTVKHS